MDICAGAGTIGLSVCKQAKKIIFIECEPSACEVIKTNAIKNNFISESEGDKSGLIITEDPENSKIEIINKRIEDCIEYISANYSNNSNVRLVGVVDPPRAGVHPTVAKKLRTFKVVGS